VIWPAHLPGTFTWDQFYFISWISSCLLAMFG
jgi:hypothetical protein